MLKILNTIKKLDVENNFKHNSFIDWKTGKSVNNGILDKDSFETHCSAYVSAICYHLNIPIFNPYDYQTEGLANKQYLWLSSQNGFDNGWRQISPIKAQELANKGYIVLASYYNDKIWNKGHIAIVISTDRNIDDVKNNGVQIAQAGLINSSNIIISKGFNNVNIKNIKYFFNIYTHLYLLTIK